ncbi:ROK family protein [Sediminicola sp. 1XM1-17]|uniref:ROK family protein n=1 Tax=Sediminicola sp. 1XM1-17 TaxID=3127702 RepID=UPI003078A4EE
MGTITRKREVVLALDIGGTYTKIGLVDKNGNIIGKRVFNTGSKNSFQGFVLNLEEEVGLLKAASGNMVKIIGIGIGAPNANFYTGQMEHPPNFKWGDTIPISDTISSLFKLPVVLANDANAAALGEYKYGMAKELKHFVVLTLGTGLGSGMVVDGKLLLGANGMAGELGHVNVDPEGRSCNCGLKGCLETYASVTGIKRTVFELLGELKEESILRKVSFDKMTGEMIAEQAIKGDVIALRAFEITGEILGSKMADTVAHLDPQAFILTGGLSKAGNVLLKPVVEHMEANLFGAYKGKVKVYLSTSESADAVLGPAALFWQDVP